MSHAQTVVAETLARAYMPDTVQYPDAVVRKALEILADGLSERGAAELAEALGGDMAERLRERGRKIERSAEELILVLAKETAVAPAIADDVYGALFESLWLVLDRTQIDALIAQLPGDVARELMAAIPGEARGRF